MPAVTFGNYRSIQAKINEQRANCRFMYQYREACCLAFTETWLDERIPDAAIDVPSFTIIRSDRDPNSNKNKGWRPSLLHQQQRHKSDPIIVNFGI